jgi:RimJ/RimL family protein N-acetyltransferase
VEDFGTVSLRPIGQDDLVLLDTWRNDPDHQSEYGDFMSMHRRRNTFRERWELDGLLGEEAGNLLICLDSEPVGALQWHSVQYGPNAGSQALSLGISVEPGVRGRGVGSLAQRLLADYLFAHTPVHRVEASTDVTNIAEQTALERAGFSREGVLRGAQFRRGDWHDMVMYSKLRADVYPPPAP